MPGLYETWEQTTNSITDPIRLRKFYDEYFAAEEEAYKILLSAAKEKTRYEGQLKDIAEELGLEPVAFSAFIDGINTSLREKIPLEGLEADTELVMDVDLRLLYRNMLDARAGHLFKLPQWDGLLTQEERSIIRREWLSTKQAVRTTAAGRNDPCPCGSGKKYKKCCWNKDHAAQAQ